MNSARVELLISTLILIVGAIHFAPVVGVLGNEQLISLYAVDIAQLADQQPRTSDSLLLLMRHRAVLFGVLGLFILIAAFKRPLQIWALIGAQINIFSFVILYLLSSDQDVALAKIMWMDIFAQTLILVVILLRLRQTPDSAPSH